LRDFFTGASPSG